MEHADALMALADPTRLKILELLLQRSYCVSALAASLGISAPAVSQHLKVCQQVELVSSVKAGYHTHYTVNRPLLQQLAQALVSLSSLETQPCEKRGVCCGKRGSCQRHRCGKGRGGLQEESSVAPEAEA